MTVSTSVTLSIGTTTIFKMYNEGVISTETYAFFLCLMLSPLLALFVFVCLLINCGKINENGHRKRYDIMVVSIKLGMLTLDVFCCLFVCYICRKRFWWQLRRYIVKFKNNSVGTFHYQCYRCLPGCCRFDHLYNQTQ